MLFFALVGVVSAFIDRENGVNLFILPELKSSRHRSLSAAGFAGQGHRLLSRDAATDNLPEVHDEHRFVGVTDMGFVDYDMVRPILLLRRAHYARKVTPPHTIPPRTGFHHSAHHAQQRRLP
jgi:hypothetical protein